MARNQSRPRVPLTQAFTERAVDIGKIETLKAKVDELEALKSEIGAQREMFKSEMDALKALVHQQHVQTQAAAPGEEG